MAVLFRALAIVAIAAVSGLPSGNVKVKGVSSLEELGFAAAPAGAGPTHDVWKEGKAGKAEDAAASAAKQSKMAAVDKVIQLIEGLKAKVLQEGEDEAHSYDKFACFCKDTTADKTAAIRKGESEKSDLGATIGELTSSREELDASIERLVAAIAGAEEEIEKATKARGAAKAEFDKNNADLVAALEALDAAIKTLKAAKPEAGFLQLRGMAQTVRRALDLADALGLAGATAATRAVANLLQQDPSVPMQDFDFHSDSIIETLEKLRTDFGAKKVDVDVAEVKSVQQYDLLVQEKKDFIATQTAELESERKRRGENVAEIEAASQQLSTVSAQLLSDQEYSMDLAKMCHEHAITWDQRTQLRADELSALTSAVSIIKDSVTRKTTAATTRLVQRKADVSVARVIATDEDSMEAIEASAEAADESPESFLQMAAAPRQLARAFMQARSDKPATAREAVIGALRMEGSKINSPLLLKLASQIEADHFAKVKKLIQELIERLLAQAAAETNQKGWCDKAIGDAEQKRTYAAEEIAEVNAEMAALEATRDKLREEIAVLEEEMAEVQAARAKAQKLRTAESAENKKGVEDATAGLEALEMAIDILSKFYKTAAKATVSMVQGPADDAPDPGFDAFEAYKGAQGSAGGILGMLDVIKSDFERTIKVTEEEEERAQQEFAEFMTATGKSLAEKEVALREKQGYLDDALEKLSLAQESLDLQTTLLRKAISELLELQPPCVDTRMSYVDRVSMREEEIEGLKKALCILQNFQGSSIDTC